MKMRKKQPYINTYIFKGYQYWQLSPEKDLGCLPNVCWLITL